MRKEKRFRKNKKPIMLLVSMILVLTVAVGGTLAYLVTQTGDVQNTFTVEQVPIKVNESFSNGVKNNVIVEHIGDDNTGRKAYVRATVVANWESDTEENAYYSKMPVEGTDYTISWTKDDWVEYPKNSGYYYYTSPLDPTNGDKDETGVLFTDCKLADGAAVPDGYHLVVDVLAQSIQVDGKDASGKTPVELAWGVTVNNDGTLNVN